MDNELVTRTRTAQLAVKRARSIVQQNNILVDEIHRNFNSEPNDKSGSDDEKSLKFFMQADHTASEENYFNDYENYKINTSSKLKNYFKDIINSMN